MTPNSTSLETAWKEAPAEDLKDWGAMLESTSCSYRQFPYWAKAYEAENHKARFFYCGSKERPTAFVAIVEVGVYPFRFGLIDRGPFFFAPQRTDIPPCLSGLVKRLKKQGYVFVRFTQGQEKIFEEVGALKNIERAEPYPFCRDSRNSMLIEQKADEAETIQSFSETARQEIRRAMRFDYDIRSVVTDDDFEKAWQMFEDLASKKGFLLSPRPKEFWREVVKLGSRENRARLYLCSEKEELIAAQIHVRDGSVCEAMLAAVDRDALGKRPSPSALMFFKGMRFGHEFGCGRYNLGGPGDPKRNNHLFEFKRKFKPTQHVAPEPLCLVLAPRRYRLWMDVLLRGWRAWRSRFGNSSRKLQEPQTSRLNAETEQSPRSLARKRFFRSLNSYVARAGPYRFVTSRYFGTSNITLTERILEIESFRNDVVPQRLPVASFKSILLLAPHQDDEVVGAGGTLVMARDAGATISIVYCTDGQQNNLGSEVRRRESQEVCDRLGAKKFELNISNLQPTPQKRDLEKLNEIIHSVKPDVILCPWLFDGAPKHRMINHILWLADRLAPLPDVEIWGYQVQNTLLPNGFVDITGVAEEKRALLECFPSQNADRHYDHLAMGLAAWNSRLLSKSPKPAFVEIFFTLPARELMKLIDRFYFKDIDLTYVGQPDVAAKLRELHQSVMKPEVGSKNGANSQVLSDTGASSEL